jgi:ribosome-interacting GTPase 1
VKFLKIPGSIRYTELLTSAMVWGSSAKHARGQKVGLDHVLEDEDGKS